MAQKSTPARKRSARAHPVEVDAHQLDVFALFNEIAIIDQLRSARFARTLPHGLTHSQFGVLNHFVRLEGVYSPKQLANAFQVSKAAMTNTLGKLSAKGYVEIRADEHDGRAKVVSITPSGVRARHDAIGSAAEGMRDITDWVTPGMVTKLLPKLREIRAFLDSHRQEDAS